MRRLLYALVTALLVAGCSNEEYGEYYPDISTRELHYISRSGDVVEFNDDAFDAPIISNTYESGRGVVRFAASLRRIGFLGSADITSITIPTTVKTFEGNPFRNCKNLARFISAYATSDGYALVSDSELIALARNYREEQYDVPYGVKAIGENALCGSLVKRVSMPNSVTKIGDRAFCDCPNLESLVLPERLEELGCEVCADCINLREVVLPPTLALDDAFAGFVGCYSLESFSGACASEDGRCIVVNNTLYAFAPMALQEYTIPAGVTAIADRSFAECDRLQKITIPPSVQKLGYGAFYNCTHLSDVYLRPATPPTIDSGTGSADLFGNAPSNLTIYVPMASVARYTSNANWARYEEHIQGSYF